MSTAILTKLKPELDFLSAAETVAPLSAAVAALDPALPSSRAMSLPSRRKLRRETAARRRARVNWDAIIVIALMLACAAVGLYRLIWMGQI